MDAEQVVALVMVVGSLVVGTLDAVRELRRLG